MHHGTMKSWIHISNLVTEMHLGQNLSFQLQVGRSESPWPFPSLPSSLHICLQDFRPQALRSYISHPLCWSFLHLSISHILQGGWRLPLAECYLLLLVIALSRVKLVLSSEFPFPRMQWYWEHPNFHPSFEGKEWSNLPYQKGSLGMEVSWDLLAMYLDFF